MIKQRADASEESGPISFLNPTTRRRPLPGKPHGRDDAIHEDEDLKPEGIQPEQSDEIKADNVHQKWRSRDNRKGTRLEAFRLLECVWKTI